MNKNISATVAAWLSLSDSERDIFAAATRVLNSDQHLKGVGPLVGLGTAPESDCVPAIDLGSLTLGLPSESGSHCRNPSADPDIFTSRTHRDRLGKGAVVLAYLAGCDGLYDLAASAGAAIFKGGVSFAHDVNSRMVTLGEERYGSAFKCDAAFKEERGFDHWRAASLPLRCERPRGSPVSVGRKALKVALPGGLTPGRFDRLLAEELSDRSLHAYAAGRAEDKSADPHLDLSRLDRFTPVHRGKRATYAVARELVIYAPRRDADDFAALIEDIIARFVTAQTD